jgi:hypothetical protein
MQWAQNDARNAVGADVFEAAVARGRAMRLDDAVALALMRP